MKRILTFFFVILILLSLCACNSPLAAKPFTTVTNFRYYSYAGSTWSEYNFVLNGDTAEITHIYRDADGFFEDQDLIATVSADYSQELTELLNSYNISAWNGYFESKDIIDGQGFGLEITTDSGQEITARGHEKYPKNYDEAASAIYDYFQQFEYTEKPEEQPTDAYADYDYVFTSIFSYKDAVERYKDEEWGVIWDGFVNIGGVTIEDPAHAIELATKEHNMEHDTINVAYDTKERIYRVTFSTAGADGGVVDVYISKDGCTLMMTIGE